VKPYPLILLEEFNKWFAEGHTDLPREEAWVFFCTNYVILGS
jgi:hypothetical protein